MNPASAFRGERAEARFERVLSVAGQVTLDVSAKAGVIRVRRGEDGQVTVRGILRAQPSILGWSAGEQVTWLAANPPVRQDGNTIRIGDVADRWLLRRILLLVEITTPAQTRIRALADCADLRIEGIDGPVDCENDSGEIEIANVTGQVSASSDSGSIHLRDVAGPVDAEADSGDIEALNIGSGIDAHTDSGNIRLSQTTAAPIYARSDSGSIRIKLPAGGGYTVRVRTDHGAIDIPELAQSESSAKEVHGAIRGGGSIISAETDSGDIEIA